MTEDLDLARRWHVARLKRGRLHAWARTRIRLAPAVRLHHKMEIHGLPLGMAPQTDVYLVCLGKCLDNLRHPLEEGTEFLGLCWGEAPKMETVAQGLNDQSPHPQGSCAVLDHPVGRGANSPSRERFSTLGEPTGVAICRRLWSQCPHGVSIACAGVTSAVALCCVFRRADCAASRERDAGPVITQHLFLKRLYRGAMPDKLRVIHDPVHFTILRRPSRVSIRSTAP